MVDLRMELLAPYAELRPERDPPRVRSPIFVSMTSHLPCLLALYAGAAA